MRVYLFNDTMNGHAGSQETMHNLYEVLSPHEIVKHHKVGEFDYDLPTLKKCDAIVMNGEGSIHHNNKKARFLMNAIATAQRFGKLTYLINTTYQDMPEEYDQVLRKLTYLSVREYASYQYIIKKGIPCEIHIDMSVNSITPRQGASLGKKGYKGDAHPDVPESVRKIEEIDAEYRGLNGDDFQTIISDLYWNAKTYFTGQYHGVIAGLLAGCYVMPFPSNSWKIEGLLMWANVNKCHPKELIANAPRLVKIPTPEEKRT